MDAASAINRLGGIATKKQLVDQGLSGFDLTAAVRRGEIRRVRRAHYATSSALPAAIAAVRVGGRLAGQSAARSYGLWSGFFDGIHVALPRNASRLRTNLAPSRSAELTPDTSQGTVILHWIDAQSTAKECWRASVPDTLWQMVRWSNAETAVACLDTARTLFGYSDVALDRVFQSATVADRLLVRRSRPGSDAGTESVVRQRLAQSGVQVEQQVAIPGVGRVDMIVTGTRIAIEVDGREFHSREDSFENDRRRDALLTSLGYVVIRLSFAQIFGSWTRCERAVLDAITQFRKL
jgi:very-short-patch-repair endonuclease